VFCQSEVFVKIIWSALLSALVLGGCAQLGMGDDVVEEYPMPVQRVAVAPSAPTYGFCRRIAAQDAAIGNPTRATQDRRQADSFRDCVVAFGDAS
jgi:hypothetical protein